MSKFLSYLPAATSHEATRSLVASDLSLASYALAAEASKALQSYMEPKQPKKSRIPPYGQRSKWVPKTLEDFESGGAFPEIPLAQFPLDMGNGASSQAVVALRTGEDGKLQYDAVIQQGLQDRVAVYTRPEALKPKWTSSETLQKHREEAADVEERTREALAAILNKKLSKGTVKSVNQDPEYIRYTPNQNKDAHNAGCDQRIVRMVEAQVDPLEPPKFQHKRKLTAADQAAWKIPPCISNWKNQKGYTIPLDKRLLADGRNLQEVTINDKFASLSESLYIAERSAREEIRLRNELLKQKRQQEEELREEQLRELATKARQERVEIQKKEAALVEEETADRDAALKLHEIEQQRRKESERELRMQRAGKRSRRLRDEDRDISEKVALGQAKPTSQATLFDSRLFNQSAGLDTGYGVEEEDKYNIYDKPLFVDRSKEVLYRYDQDRMAQSLGSMSAVAAFAGADTSKQRTAPVEFEADMSDPFGLASLVEASTKAEGSGHDNTKSGRKD